MTRDDAKILWPIIKAWSEGKTLQDQDELGQWSDAPHAAFCMAPHRYRIKPEPVECWGVLNSDGSLNIGFVSEAKAREYIYQGHPQRLIKLREVSE